MSEQMPSEARLRELLVGRSIAAVEITDGSPEPWTDGPTGTITLSDGTMLRVWGNDGGCACSSGCYPLTELNGAEGVITNVRVDEKPDDEEACEKCGSYWCECADREERGFYRVFVVVTGGEKLLASFDGSDGNGYYGTGWWLEVAA